MDTYRVCHPGSSNIKIVAVLSHLKVKQCKKKKVIHGSTVKSYEQTFEKWKEHTAQLLQSSRQPLALVRIGNVSGAEQNRKKGESSSQIVSAYRQGKRKHR